MPYPTTTEPSADTAWAQHLAAIRKVYDWLVTGQVLELNPTKGKAIEDELFFWSGKQPDAAEGVNSFLEKRDPQWKMSAARDLPDLLPDLE